MRIALVRRERGNAISMDVYADNLISQLKKIRSNWEFIEIAPQSWSNKIENSWHSGNPVKKYYERFWRYPQVVCQQNVDLFHIIDHTDGHIAYWLKKSGKPILITCHDLVQFVYPEILKDQSRLPALSMASWRYSVGGMKVANRIIAVSENTAKDVSKMLNIESQKITVVSNGVDPQFRVLSGDSIERLRQQYSNSPKEICLLNVGSTHQRKNILTILKVLETLRERDILARLWKVGSDFTVEQKKYICEHHLESQINFLGQPDKKMLIALYNAADTLLAPSLYEGFGLTILEAMACGTPVITSNVSSLPEVGANAAILLSPLDVNAIVESICFLKYDLLYRQSLIDSGLIRASLFTWLNTAKKMTSIYENLSEIK
ncbi:glycosyltransferase family 1 protein [Myxosarcina sp. GI1]|uniref:glycosyltransferase family 4 protein n=1 Tax=Myxosarcina sp. GI1 TaxID=1541065 RepID=UPI0005669DD7|nr:glycosyltransferase family 1 protein [Myxosarcina sp. GI1]